MPKKPVKYYDIIQNKAEKTAEILIYGVIGDSWWEESTTAKQFVSDFRKLEKENDRINIRLNSPGGSVFDGLAIYNAISASEKEVHTYNDGVCASMAAVLLLAVDSEKVHPANNSLLMLHSPSTGAWGNRKDIENALNVLDKVQKVLITSICEKTGLDESDIENNYFDYKDHWLTADEAKEAGLYAQVEETEAENIPENISGMKFSDLVKLFEPSNSLFPDWINRITPAKPDNSTNFIDMDIKKMTAAYGLPDDSTEEAILAHIAKREKEITDLTTAKDKAETDLATANAEIADLKKKPGAESATANTDTDSKGGEDKVSNDFFDAYSECMDVLNPEKK